MAIHVIEVKNPFERKIDNQYYQTYVGGPVTDYVTHADCERVFAVNGIPVDETYIPDDGDEILVAPKVGKKAFRWILPVTFVFAGALLGAGIIGANMLIGWRIGLSLAATMIGNHMIEKMTKPAVDLTNTEQSNTYGWGGLLLSRGRGMCFLFFTAQSRPQVLCFSVMLFPMATSSICPFSTALHRG